MRITAWNCRRGPWAAKRSALETIGADVAVLSEAPRPAADEDGVAWFGHTNLGVAVVVRPPFRIKAISRAAVPDVYPVRIVGPVKFTLLAVWTRGPSYRAALLNGLRAYVHLPRPWVVAGDFNGNVCFDRPRQKLKWQDSFDILKAKGLVSAYHTFSGAVAGKELVATHYFLTRRERPFHIDYCYIPRVWASRLESVRIAPFEEFAALSDHRPVTATIRFDV